MFRSSPYFHDAIDWDPIEVMAMRMDMLMERIPQQRSLIECEDRQGAFMNELNLDEIRQIMRYLDLRPGGQRGKPKLIEMISAQVKARAEDIIRMLPTRAYRLLLDLIDEGGHMVINEPLLAESAMSLQLLGLAIVRVRQMDSVDLYMSRELIDRVSPCLSGISEAREAMGLDRIGQAIDRLLEAYGVLQATDVMKILEDAGLMTKDREEEGIRIFSAMMTSFDTILLQRGADENPSLYMCDLLINDPAEILEARKEIGEPAPIDMARLLSDAPEDYVLFTEEAECLDSMLTLFDPLFEEEEEVMICMQTISQAIKQGFSEEVVLFQGIEMLGPRPFQVYESLNGNIRRWMNRMNLWTLYGYTKASAHAARYIREVGRNDPCPCGSGKKYKHCCGNPLRVIK